MIKSFLCSEEVYQKIVSLSQDIKAGYQLKDISSDVFQYISIDSLSCAAFIVFLLRQKYKIEEIPNELMQSVLKDRNMCASMVFMGLLENGYRLEEIPKELRYQMIEGICSSGFSICGIIEKMLDLKYRLDEIPYEFLKHELKRAGDSLFCVQLLLKKGYVLREIPEKLIDKISEDSYCFCELIRFLIIDQKYKLSEIPTQLYGRSLGDSYVSLDMIEILIKQGYKLSEIPQMWVYGVLIDNNVFCKLIEFLVKNGYSLQDVLWKKIKM